MVGSEPVTGILIALTLTILSLPGGCGKGERDAEPVSGVNSPQERQEADVEAGGDEPPDDETDAAADGIPVLLEPHTPRSDLLQETGLLSRSVASVSAALSATGSGVVVVDGTVENLKALIEARDRLAEFTGAGGWVMIWGVTPDSLADFNKLVGVEHLIRPFEMEEVELPLRADPLLKGINRREVFMETGTTSGGVVPVRLRVDDAWSYVVDGDDIAPFCAFPGREYWRAEEAESVPGQPHCPRSMVNGLTYQWRWAFLIRLDRNEPLKWSITFPREEEVVEFSVMPSRLGYEIAKIRLTFDDGPDAVELDLKPEEERQDFAIPAQKATSMAMEIAEWRELGDKMKNVGIVNLWIKVRRSREFYDRAKPLLNIGVLVMYPMGGPASRSGGIILNQLRVPERESNPRNATKKQKILKTLLRNLDAYSRGRQ